MQLAQQLTNKIFIHVWSTPVVILYISYLNSFSIVIIKLLWNSIINYLTNTSVKPASKNDNIL